MPDGWQEILNFHGTYWRRPDTCGAQKHLNPQADDDPPRLKGAVANARPNQPHDGVIGEHAAAFHEHGRWIEKNDEAITRVVRLHGNSGSRVEGSNVDAVDGVFCQSQHVSQYRDDKPFGS